MDEEENIETETEVPSYETTSTEGFKTSSIKPKLEVTTIMAAKETEIYVETSTQSTIYNFTFFGDYDTVDDHKKKHHVTTITVSHKVPDICEGNFDAISSIRGEVFIFKGPYVWRLTDKYKIENGYPVQIGDIFIGLPEYVFKVDAVYEREFDQSIIIFSGIYIT